MQGCAKPIEMAEGEAEGRASCLGNVEKDCRRITTPSKKGHTGRAFIEINNFYLYAVTLLDSIVHERKQGTKIARVSGDADIV